MLRDGLISPRSKVIAALDTSIRPGSTISSAGKPSPLIVSEIILTRCFSVSKDKDWLVQGRPGYS